MGSYLRPTSLPEALAALAAAPRIVLAGGTDYYPARVGRPPEDDLLDITAIPALSGIAETEEGWRIGAATTWTEVIEAPLPPLFDGLRAAGREVGGAQEVRDVVHGLGRQHPQDLRVDLEERPSVHLEGADPLGGQQPVRRRVRPQGQQVGVAEVGSDGHGPRG